MTKKNDPLNEWITSKEAAQVLTELSEHPVSDAYVRLLGNKGKLTTKQIDERTKLYNKQSVQGYRVGKRQKSQEGDTPHA